MRRHITTLHRCLVAPRLLALSVALCVLAASAASAASAAPSLRSAASALTLAWQDCRAGTGVSTTTFGCATNTVDFHLFPAFQLASAVDSVVAIECVVDLISQTDPVPPWWQLGPTGCRANALTVLPATGTACADPWSGNGSAQLQAYRVSPETPTMDRARIVFTVGVLPAQAVTLTSGQPYITADLDLATRGTIGTGSCSGCSSTACLVFNSVTLKRLPGASVTDILISDPASSANWAFWQGTVGVDCAAVPVRNHTWGALKSLYR